MKESASQTAGPYVHIGCVPSFAGLEDMYGGVDPGSVMVTGEPAGRRIAFTGAVFDGEGAPLCDALIEVWQADGQGNHGPSNGFTGWGRQPSDGGTGAFRFDTIKPGAVDGQAPHLSLWIVARGINLGLHTRAYFDDEAEANAADSVLRLAGERAGTMIARTTPEGFHMDIYLQGDNETVFLDV
ncbi:protocatechuate 3,4-dioxygenase subunit alpha [Jannaschia seosinensis]|uniref:protocatechuate 3,4-dioxygenase subunit alpha n=1 Tax=Jannaschia seosinensis TaxID=313367 RepID=UPI001FE0A4BD|nr:protocatechuate 3,4-dioxygenase subunit alpha [Jannaschia seosinensis]